MEKTRLLQCSCVVVAQHHNPTILNPDFLKSHKVVPVDWDLAPDEQVFTTPMSSRIAYKNGVVITVDPERFQVAESSPSLDLKTTHTFSIIDLYVKLLPYVNYTSIGINFHSVFLTDKPDLYIMKRFLQSGKWLTDPLQLGAASIRFLYALKPEGRLTVSLDAGGMNERDASGNKKSHSGVLTNSNFHRALSSTDSVQMVNDTLNRVEEDLEQHATVLRTIFGLGDQ